MKFSDVVGFINTENTSPGVWTPDTIERRYRGDVLSNTRRFENGESINDNLTVSNRISIVADSYILENSHYIRYVTWKKQRWKVSNIDISHPRIILTLGGIYNGPEEEQDTPGDIPGDPGDVSRYY